MANSELSGARSARDWAALALMLIAAVGALYAFVTAVSEAAQAAPATQQIETWRALGFAFFTGVFVLLGVWPRRYPGLWELAILDKGVLTIVEAFVIRGAKDAQSAAVADAILTVVLVAAYVLGRGYSAWRRPRR